MNLLFLTIANIDSLSIHGMYQDLLREFVQNGHKVYVVSPTERRNKEATHIIEEENYHVLKVRTGNMQKCNIVEKGISTIFIENQFIRAIKKYYSDIHFDLILYSTPPITFVKAIEYVKKRDKAKSYLLLKDIFPQNAVDLGLMKTTGLKGLIYRYFRNKEKQLYAVSDKIGCMSLANCEYILRHNSGLSNEKVEVCPNCIEVRDMRLTDEERNEMRKQYGFPQDKKIFVYGGNLGKPQDVPFIVSCLKKCVDLTEAYFVVAGSGTDRNIFEKYIQEENPSHVKLFGQIPKDEYDKMIACCDVGLIFLDHRFTIPNFPSRLLSYMQAGLPVFACTDTNTDIGKVIVDGRFGWWCESNDARVFVENATKIDITQLRNYGAKAFDYLNNNYTAEIIYKIIEKEEL